MVSAFDDLGNPYLEGSGDLFSLDTKRNVGKDVMLRKLGKDNIVAMWQND